MSGQKQPSLKIVDAPPPIKAGHKVSDGAMKTGLIEEGRYKVTPAFAEQILERFNYASQRRVERSHIARSSRGTDEAMLISTVCWNAWYRKKTITLARTGSTESVRPLGTPFAKP